MSCRKGKLDVCRWLYTLGVDTHAYDDGAFVSSCESSRIEVARWFYSLGDFDIHAEDDFAFTSSCQKLWENPLIVIIVNLRNRTGEEGRRPTLCDKRDNNFV